MNRPISGLMALVAASALLTTSITGSARAAAAADQGVAHTAVGGYRVSAPVTIKAISSPRFHTDALYSDFHSHGAWYGYINGPGRRAYYFKEGANGQVSKPEPIPGLAATPVGSHKPDNCGVWPVGRFYERSSKLWVGFFHEEQSAPADGNKCVTAGHHKRWTIRRMVSYDQGMHWHKDKIVVSQDTALLRSGKNWSYATDDAGSPRLVIKGSYMYLFYRAANRDSAQASQPQQASVARSLLSDLGKRGTWHKYYNGGWSQPGIGGQQSQIPNMPDKGRGISWNTTLNSYLNVAVEKKQINLYVSDGRNLLKWRKLTTLVTFPSNSGWHASCKRNDVPWAIGYAALRGRGGGTTTGRRFWVYDMEKPRGKCISKAGLERRRLVTLPR